MFDVQQSLALLIMYAMRISDLNGPASKPTSEADDGKFECLKEGNKYLCRVSLLGFVCIYPSKDLLYI